MLNATLSITVLCTFLVPAALAAQPISGGFQTVQSTASSEPTWSEPATGPKRSTAASDSVLPPSVVASVLLADIASWLSQSFDVPASATIPRIEIASPERFATVRYRRLVEGQQGGAIPGLRDQLSSGQFDDVVAFYENASQTIFLREGWTGRTPQEVSVLVHEMVHHLQNMAGIKYACPAAREKLAYAAQQEWLELSGHDFFEAFETDPMTLLVRTACGF